MNQINIEMKAIFSFQNDLNQVVLEWNVHRIRATRNSISPTGRPCMMFDIPSLFHGQNYLQHVSNHVLDVLSSECLYLQYPCDEDFYLLCESVMTENRLSKTNDLFETVDLYLQLRTKITELFT